MELHQGRFGLGLHHVRRSRVLLLDSNGVSDSSRAICVRNTHHIHDGPAREHEGFHDRTRPL